VSNKLSEVLKEIRVAGDCGGYLEGLSEKAEALENRSNGHIEGVPNGWKFVRWCYASNKDRFLCDESNKVLTWQYKDKSVVKLAIVECDVQVIDMSKCRVDCEYETNRGWIIANSKSGLFSSGCSVRVRQNHYFGWRGGECPLPEGVKVKVRFRDDDIDYQTGNAKDFNWMHDCHDVDSSIEIVGYYALGAMDTHVYAHELNSGQD
jgi:hypothetical protein